MRFLVIGAGSQSELGRRREATRFAMAATNHSQLTSGKMRSVEMIRMI